MQKFRIGLQEKGKKIVYKYFTIDQLLTGKAWDQKKFKIVSKDQFTGRIDIKGKEIYDNDVLGLKIDETVDEYEVVVRWQSNKLRWSVFCPDAESTADWGYIPDNAFVTGKIWGS